MSAHTTPRALVVALTVLAGCSSVDSGWSWDGTGTVVGHEYDDPDDWTTTHNVCFSYNAQGVCTFNVPQTDWHHDDAHWYVTVRGRPFGEHRREVDEDTYEHCQIGRSYPECPG